jgi:methionine-rich copper-binding protein CopC
MWLECSSKDDAANGQVVADRKQINNKDSMVDKSDRTVIRASLPSLKPGVYGVECRAVSADTHKVSGDFTFKIGD